MRISKHDADHNKDQPSLGPLVFRSPHAPFSPGRVPPQPLHPASSAAEDPQVHTPSGDPTPRHVLLRLRSLAVHEDDVPRGAAAAHAHQVREGAGGMLVTPFDIYFQIN